MIGDNQIYPETMCSLRRSESAYTRIHTDNQMNARARGALDDITPQVVTFLDAMGHVEVGRAPAQLDRRFQDDDGGGAVDVVVAVDEDGFAGADGLLDARDRRSI